MTRVAPSSRATVMGIVGNLQIQQDRFRSRGYAGLLEYALEPTLAAGISSMVTNTELDLALLTPTWRHAHGAFVRYSPSRLAVVGAEWDFLHTSQPTPGTTTPGVPEDELAENPADVPSHPLDPAKNPGHSHG